MLATRMRQAASGVGGSVDQYAIDFNGSSTNVDCGSDASLDNLHHAAMTVEFWAKLDGFGAKTSLRFVDKYGSGPGWVIFPQKTGGLEVTMSFTVTSAHSGSGLAYFPADSTWRHAAVTWDSASYNYPRIWVDGTERTTDTINKSGTIEDESSEDWYIGDNPAGNRTLDGAIAWMRVSDVVRYTTGFTPPAKDAPPAVDGNTVEQWNFNEGSGVTAGAEVNGSNDGTISNGSWVSL